MTNASRFAAAAITASLLLAGCGEPGGPLDAGSGDGDAPVSNEPVLGCYNPADPPDDPSGMSPCPEPDAPAGPARIEPRSDLVNVRAQRWERVEVAEDGLSLDVIFWGGVEDCYGVERVEVEERRRRVIVTLYTGRVPTAEVCIEIALEQFVWAELEEPVGDRRIVDGAPRQD